MDKELLKAEIGAAEDGSDSTSQRLDDAKVQLKGIIDDKFDEAAMEESDHKVER